MSENDLELPELAPIQDPSTPQKDEELVLEENLPEKVDFFETLQSLPLSTENPSVDSFLEPPALEQIENFETLEEYHPTDLPPPDTQAEPMAPSLALPTLESAPFRVEEHSEPIPQTSSQPAALQADLLGTDLSEKPNTLDAIKQEIDFPKTATPLVPAAFPLTLLIEGPLKAHEKTKLLDFLAQEQMGIREIELEPQWASEKILIPRISEYAAVLLVQALRTSHATFQLKPSEDFDSQENPITPIGSSMTHPTQNIDPPLTEKDIHPAEQIPISAATMEEYLDKKIQLLDTVTASEILNPIDMELEESQAFEKLLAALQKELRYKAYRKGATLILHFKLQTLSLSSPKQYRLVVSGSAFKQI